MVKNPKTPYRFTEDPKCRRRNVRKRLEVNILKDNLRPFEIDNADSEDLQRKKPRFFHDA